MFVHNVSPVGNYMHKIMSRIYYLDDRRSNVVVFEALHDDDGSSAGGGGGTPAFPQASGRIAPLSSLQLDTGWHVPWST